MRLDFLKRSWVFAAAVVLGTSSQSLSQTVTVTTLHDAYDFPLPRRVENLPGPDGRVSFLEACDAANNTPGPQTIEFAVPQSEFWLVTNLALLELDAAPFVLYDDGTTIDFTSQTRNIGDTNPNGPDIGIYGLQPNGWGSPAIIVDASDCLIRGLGPVWQRGASVAVWQGHGNRIVGCQTGTIEVDGTFGGPPVTGTIIGGVTPEDANTLDAVEILCWSNDNIVIGNRLKHVRVEGSQYCVYPTGNRIGGPTPAERNVISGYGRYGEEGFPTGSQVDVVWAQNTLIEGNYIGTTVDGLAREPQIGPTGVGIVDSIDTIVRGNVIAGLRTVGGNHYQGQLFGAAISIGATNNENNGVIVEGNLIGLGADGATPIPTLNGIVVAPFTALQHVRTVRIGGTVAGQGNEFGFLERYGVVIASLENGVTISGNSMHDSGFLAIELTRNSGADGVTPNDPLDADSGANRLQNFPALASASAGSATLRIVGALDSAESRAYSVEFFASQTCDPSGHGEGQVFLGASEVVTDAAGHAPLDATLSAAVPVGWVITSTATDVLSGDTSEFSACVATLPGGGPPGDVDGDGHVTLTDLAMLLASFGACSGDPAFIAAADFDGSGCVDLSDLAVLLARFGS